MNNVCQQVEPRTKEECIAKYNELARPASNNATTNNSSSTAPAADNATASTTKAADTDSSKPASSSTTTTTVSAEDWTAEQDQLLQKALATFPASMDKNERWSSIAAAVPGKSKKECVQRFKAIREALKKS